MWKGLDENNQRRYVNQPERPDATSFLSEYLCFAVRVSGYTTVQSSKWEKRYIRWLVPS